MMKPAASELKRIRSSAQLALKPSKKEDYFHCGFNVHVEKAGMVIAAVSAVVSLTKVVQWRSSSDGIIALVLCLAMILASGSILCAQHFKLPKLYLPYLVVNPFCVLSLLNFYAVSLIGVLLAIPHLKRFAIEAHLEEDVILLNLAQPVVVLELLMLVLVIAVMVCAEVIIFRAYRYMIHCRVASRLAQNGEAGRRNIYYIEPKRKLLKLYSVQKLNF